MAVLKHHNGVSLQIRQVELLASPYDFRVLVHHQPAYVREPQPTLRIVRVAIRLAELVVNTVVAAPVVDRSLVARTAHEHQEKANRCSGLVASMSPEAMGSGRDSKSSNLIDENKF